MLSNRGVLEDDAQMILVRFDDDGTMSEAARYGVDVAFLADTLVWAI